MQQMFAVYGVTVQLHYAKSWYSEGKLLPPFCARNTAQHSRVLMRSPLCCMFYKSCAQHHPCLLLCFVICLSLQFAAVGQPVPGAVSYL